MNSYLLCPLKKTQSVDIVKPISNYITNTFSSSVLNENKNVLAEFSQLRSNAVIHSLDKHEVSLETLQRYYDQLVVMEGKLPIAEDQIRISFTWYDAFNKGSIFGSTKCSLSSGAYERFCVLFNIAALLSQLASMQNHSTDDGLKTAAKYYQQSAGIFSYLKDNVFPVLRMLPTPDLSVSCLTALTSIMLAQAQDCFYEKASSDKMKDTVVAKIAMQAADFYQDAHRNATHYETKGLWEKDWITVLQTKHGYFIAAAEFHQSKVNEASNKYGERVARLQKAEKSINDAIKSAGNFNIPEVKNMAGIISKTLIQAKKDNEFIYLDKVPTPDQLAPVERANLVKALPIASPMSSNFQDLFLKLVPIAVHEATSTYDAAKSALINSEIGKLREATHFINGVLASLNLPAAIEDLSGEMVPSSVLEKSAEIKEKGGLEVIDQMIENLPNLLSRNREILDETFHMMSEEEQDDQKMREYFKDRWTRTPSSKLTQQLKEEGAKYKNILDNATNADNIVKAKYNEHQRGLQILSKSNAEIASSLPKVGVITSNSGLAAVQELRQYMQQVDQIKKAREQLEEEFKSTTVDIQSKFLQALTAEGYLDCQKIVGQNIEDVYAHLRNQAEKSIEDQKLLLEKIQTAYDSFAAATKGAGANPRDQMLKDLASAYDAYIELTNNLEEGSKFYYNLTELLLKFQNKVSDLVFARKTEKEDLTKDLQQEAAKGTAIPPPNIPAHHQQQPTKPDRPPPPSNKSTPAPSVPQNQPSSNPPEQPQYNPNPYPVQPMFMPQPGYYAPTGMMPYPYPYQPNYREYPANQTQVQPGQYIPPYVQQQPPMGYQGYQWQQRPPQQ